MFTVAQVIYFSKSLRVLYVEDDSSIRQSMQDMFKLLFHHIDSAEDGIEGLQYYREYDYDIVITDINMPRMNGIEMIEKIHEINPEQKVIAVSANDASGTLIDLMHKGVHNFLLKPVQQQQILNIFYPVCRDAHAQKENLFLFDALNEERKKLQSKIKELESQNNATLIKHQQVSELLEIRDTGKKADLIEEYFAKDEDEGAENVLFQKDDCDEMSELLSEMPEQITEYLNTGNIENIHHVSRSLMKISSVLLHYSPFLDTLALSFSELGVCIKEEVEMFSQMITSSSDHVFMLWDAINLDMIRYIERFSRESMAMKNIHHIHTPTSLSIQQIIVLIRPPGVNEGEIEFF